VGVLVLGILDGVIVAVLASVIMLLGRVARPHVAFLGRIPGTDRYSDADRHPENEPIHGVLAFRVEASTDLLTWLTVFTGRTEGGSFTMTHGAAPSSCSRRKSYPNFMPCRPTYFDAEPPKFLEW
jgi:hypothetical protein